MHSKEELEKVIADYLETHPQGQKLVYVTYNGFDPITLTAQQKEDLNGGAFLKVTHSNRGDFIILPCYATLDGVEKKAYGTFINFDYSNEAGTSTLYYYIFVYDEEAGTLTAVEGEIAQN